MNGQPKRFLKKGRIATEVAIIAIICFVLLFISNWALVTVNFMRPEKLEETMRWRGVVSRSLWCLFIALWILMRTKDSVSTHGANRPTSMITEPQPLRHYSSRAATAITPFLPVYTSAPRSSCKTPMAKQALRKTKPSQITQTVFANKIWGQRHTRTQAKSNTGPQTHNLLHKRRRIFYYGAVQEHRYATLYRFVAYSYAKLPKPLQQNTVQADIITCGCRNSLENTSHVPSNSETWVDDREDKPTVHRDIQNEKIRNTIVNDNNNEPKEEAVGRIRLEMKKALHRKELQQEAFSRFFGMRYISIVRVTRPDHPRAVEQCEFDTSSCEVIKARPLPSSDSSEWIERDFDFVFGTSSTNLEIYAKLEPITMELNDPQGRTICLGTDGFSGSGKSYTMENLLYILGKELFKMHLPDRQLIFEAFQSLGTDIDPLNLSEKDLLSHGIRKMDQSPLGVHAAPLPWKRPCYRISSQAAFNLLLSKTLDFRTSSSTNNNKTSSRTHLVVLIYASRNNKTSTLCMFDLAGNERSDALIGIVDDAKARLDQTVAINDSRMKVYAVLRYALRRKERVTRETAIGTLLMKLLLRRRSVAVMLFHLSCFASFNGAVMKTLEDANSLITPRILHQKGSDLCD